MNRGGVHKRTGSTTSPAALCSLSQDELIAELVRRNGGKDPYPLKSDRYLNYIRSRSCINCGYPEAEPHHLHVFNEKHTRRWADICNTVPLCRKCHIEIHNDPKLEIKGHYKRKAVNIYVEWGKDND